MNMGVDLAPEQIEKILQGIAIPPQPQIMVDLQMEQMQPGCCIDTITQLISRDVGLSGSILKTVNSPFFNTQEPVTCVNEAVTMLGIDSVINIFNALSIRGALTDEAIISLNRFWDSAQDVAAAAAAIARYYDCCSPEEAYTVGLFHNCGVALMMTRYSNYSDIMHTAYGETTRRVIDIENDTVNTNHAVIGYYVAKSWNLPTHLCEVIADHHSADAIFNDHDFPDHNKKTLLAVLKMAEHLCANHQVLGDQPVDYEWERIAADLLIHLGISSYDLTTIAEHISELGIAGGNSLS